MPKLITPTDTPDIPILGEPEYGRVIIPNIEITGPRLLIYPKPRKELTTGTGIIIPEQAQEFSQEGVVILTGDGIMLENGTRIPPRVRPGQAIIYARYAGVELEMEGHKFIIIQESEVRCILTYKGVIFKLEDPEPVD